MTIGHAAGVLVSSPDAFVHVDGRVGVAEYKIVQPWNADRWPAGVLEVSTLADLDNASNAGRWPVSRQYVVQAMVHLLCTGLDFVDLFAVFAKDVQLGHVVDGWDSPIAVEGTARLRIYSDPDTLAAVLHSINAAHKEIVIDGKEPTAHAPPPPGMQAAIRCRANAMRRLTSATRSPKLRSSQQRAARQRIDWDTSALVCAMALQTAV